MKINPFTQTEALSATNLKPHEPQVGPRQIDSPTVKTIDVSHLLKRMIFHQTNKTLRLKKKRTLTKMTAVKSFKTHPTVFPALKRIISTGLSAIDFQEPRNLTKDRKVILISLKKNNST